MSNKLSYTISARLDSTSKHVVTAIRMPGTNSYHARAQGFEAVRDSRDAAVEYVARKRGLVVGGEPWKTRIQDAVIDSNGIWHFTFQPRPSLFMTICSWFGEIK